MCILEGELIVIQGDFISKIIVVYFLEIFELSMIDFKINYQKKLVNLGF